MNSPLCKSTAAETQVFSRRSNIKSSRVESPDHPEAAPMGLSLPPIPMHPSASLALTLFKTGFHVSFERPKTCGPGGCCFEKRFSQRCSAAALLAGERRARRSWKPSSRCGWEGWVKDRPSASATQRNGSHHRPRTQSTSWPCAGCPPAPGCQGGQRAPRRPGGGPRASVCPLGGPCLRRTQRRPPADRSQAWIGQAGSTRRLPPRSRRTFRNSTPRHGRCCCH